jgi:hypothetical protein
LPSWYFRKSSSLIRLTLVSFTLWWNPVNPRCSLVNFLLSLALSLTTNSSAACSSNVAPYSLVSFDVTPSLVCRHWSVLCRRLLTTQPLSPPPSCDTVILVVDNSRLSLHFQVELDPV